MGAVKFIDLAFLSLIGLYALVRHLRNKRLALRHPIRRAGTRIEVVLGDITTQEVDVIVNAAKSSLLGGGGVDGAIHRKGGRAILDECYELRASLYPGGLPAGKAVSTTAGNLPAEWVVHTVGPVYDPAKDQSDILRSCYAKSLAEADRLGARTVAFPLISSGVYGWPKDDAVRQALAALRAAVTGVEAVLLVIYDRETYGIAQAVMRG